MPTYSYKALNGSGKTVIGEIAAADSEELRRELAGQGLLVQRVRRKGRSSLGVGWRRGVRPENFLLFNQELIALLRAGLTVPDALALTAERPGDPLMQRLLSGVLTDVKAGLSLSQACRRYPEMFDNMYVSAVATGERSGDLVQVLTRFQGDLRRAIALRKEVARALSYPLFLLLTLLVVLGALFAFVLPRFIAVYTAMDAELPTATLWLMAAVERFPVYGPGLAVAGLLVYAAYRGWTRTGNGGRIAAEIKLRLPLLGGILSLHGVASTARTLGTLLAAGTPLVDALAIGAESAPDRATGARLLHARQAVLGGASFSHAARDQRLMPATAIKMIEAGEASGNLAGLLGEVADFYEETLSYRLGRLIALVEPVLMLIMGVFVGGIIVVMYLPIFSMAEVLG